MPLTLDQDRSGPPPFTICGDSPDIIFQPMRLPRTFTYSATATCGLVGGAVNGAADPRIVLKDRSYYAYGYEGDATPNG